MVSTGVNAEMYVVVFYILMNTERLCVVSFNNFFAKKGKGVKHMSCFV